MSASVSGQTVTDTERVDYQRDIRPLLVQHCYACHGPEKQESNFRLDHRDRAWQGGDLETPPIVAGRHAESPLWQFVAGTSDSGRVMPPDGERRLEPSEIDLVARWIDQGADWPADADPAPVDLPLKSDHWSFQPLRRATLPPLLRRATVPQLLHNASSATTNSSEPSAESSAGRWGTSPIDAWIGHGLQAQQLEPSPEADRRTLIRRLSLDLLGLPPTPEQVAAFVNDRRPQAYQRLVDSMLASPRYGERWARHWLDIVRFGESHGFETNPERPRAYPYRDYVIASWNADKPYDRFVVEQLAGDALGADVGTGFLVGGPYDQVKSPDLALTLMQRQDELADMINTTGTTFLALTIGCARCHNHKFDPITQSDYYALQAVLSGVQHGERPVPGPRQLEVHTRLQKLDGELEAERRELAKLKELAQARPDPAQGQSSLRDPVRSDGNLELFPAVNARWLRFTIRATNSGEPCLDELEVLRAHVNANAQGAAEEATAGAADENVALASAGTRVTASGTLPGYAIHRLEHIQDGLGGNEHSWISDRSGTGWVMLEFPAAVTIDRVRWARDREGQFRDRTPIDYVIEVAAEPDQWQVVASSADRRPPENQGDDSPQQLKRLWQRLDEADADRARELQKSVAELERQRELLVAAMPTAYIGTFAPPAAIHRLHRGDPMSPREPVAPDTLRVLGSLHLAAEPSEQERRLALARWMASPENPLTARVIANRLWQYHFGTGLVATPSDFGANGLPPTHPELLDWLAGQLIDGQWSIKRLQREIVLSSTYRQSSQPRSDAMAVDAGNRWLWRFAPRRLEAEAIRDSVLTVSGSLNLQMGGPGFSVFEVQRETVHHYFPRRDFGPNEWRRMVYMTKIRQQQDAAFGVFDCPDGGQVAPVRSRSTTPLQALNLLNSDFQLQQARLLAARIERECGADVPGKVRRAFQLLLGRDPSADELEDSRALIEGHGLEAFCRAMLNANEFLFIS